MRIIEGFEEARAILSRESKVAFGADDREQSVREIINNVRDRGDAALFEYTLKFDKVKLKSLEVTKKQVQEAYSGIDDKLVAALKLAAERIRTFHALQGGGIRGFASKYGASRIRPLERVGAYAPGGTASYPSTVLMTAVTAKVAGVKEVILTTPAGKDGIPAATLVAADIAQVDRIFAIGGAQAIAALAFGTESVPKVDKICGPGNIWVTLAKKLVYGVVGIDGLAGPSEVLIIADDTASTEYCASDVLAQAEHDALATAIVITASKQFADKVNREIEKQLADLPRKTIAADSLKNNGIIAVVSNIDQAIELANLYAPEHLCLMVDKAKEFVDKITNAGCIVVGRNSTVALGDYVAGPSHVLPTGGTARFGSPLNITDFVKFTSVVDVDEADMEELCQAAQTIARAEGLEAHARAAGKRLKNTVKDNK